MKNFQFISRKYQIRKEKIYVAHLITMPDPDPQNTSHNHRLDQLKSHSPSLPNSVTLIPSSA